MPKIILASQSPRRRELLSQIGAAFECRVSTKEEIRTTDDPEEAVKELSGIKARDVASFYDRENGHYLIIGADTVVSVDGQILGKPKDRADAIRMISLLQGKEHEVLTGVTLIGKTDGRTVFEETFASRTEVTVCPMGQDQIEAYVDSGESMDKAGAYAIQGLFAAYISGINGDYNNVVGLPVSAIYQKLLELGIDIRRKEHT